MSRKGKKKPPLKSERTGQEEIPHPAGGPPQVFGPPWFAILVLVAAVLAGYANSLRCPFVFDDRPRHHRQPGDPPPVARLGMCFSSVPRAAWGCNPGPW